MKHALGHEAGVGAAGWVFDGRADESTYRRMLRGIGDCDPEILDGYNVPNLSGEWAGDPTPRSLAEDLGISPDSDAIEDACEAWEDGAYSGFWTEVERIARLNVPPDVFTRRRDAIRYLMADGDLRVPCSRYGRWTSDVAGIAWQVARIVQRETDGGPVTREGLDHAMSLTVNDSADVSYLVNAYGHGHYER